MATTQAVRQHLLLRTVNHGKHTQAFSAAKQVNEEWAAKKGEHHIPPHHEHGEAREARQASHAPLHAAHQQASHAAPIHLPPPQPKKKVGIIGGGIAGLYAAYLLKDAHNLDVTILESENRVGGRIKTFKFHPEGKYQYGEFGAMRIPGYHEQVIKVIKEVGLEEDLIPFIYDNDNTLFYVNNTRQPDGKIMTKKYANAHPGELGFMKITVKIEREQQMLRAAAFAPEDFSAIELWFKADVKNPEKTYGTVAAIFDAVYADLAVKLKQQPDKFLDEYDQYSVYSYFHKIVPEWLHRDLSRKVDKDRIEALVDSVLHYAETTSSATGYNLLGIVESVLDNRNFESDKGWFTILGGMEKFPQAMASKLKAGSIRKECRVTDIEPTPAGQVKVKWAHGSGEGSDTFDHIIVTAPFASVRFMHITVPFTYGKKQAIRSLNYDQATKVFCQFPDRWWEKENKLVGGQSVTDLPARLVVYPSYGVEDKGKGVLLTSYTWRNEAIMWANVDEQFKKTIILRDLQTLHSREKPFDPNTVEIETHAWLEAYAFFGPGQFKIMINAMIPEHGVHFAGEHLSTYHAWIIGALNSSTRAVREILVQEGNYTVDSSFEKYPDTEFTPETWRQYMSNVKC